MAYALLTQAGILIGPFPSRSDVQSFRFKPHGRSSHPCPVPSEQISGPDFPSRGGVVCLCKVHWLDNPRAVRSLGTAVGQAGSN